MLIILCFCSGFFCALVELAAIAENVPRLASARKTPVRTTNSPIKTRRLKKADREADFFFMSGCEVDGIKCEAQCAAELPYDVNTFSSVVVIA